LIVAPRDLIATALDFQWAEPLLDRPAFSFWVALQFTALALAFGWCSGSPLR
jgi:hypothetical protein